MTGSTKLGLAALCAGLTWCGAAAADVLESEQVFEVRGERWRVAGIVISKVTGAELVVFEEEATRRSKITRRKDPPFQGVAILAVSGDKVLLEVEGRTVQLSIGGSSGIPPGALAAPSASGSEAIATVPKVSSLFTRVRLTVGEFQDAAKVLRRALHSGDISLGQDERGGLGVVINRSPAGGIVDRLGLEPGDVVVAVDGKPAASEQTALSLLDAAPDQSIPYAFHRGDEVGQGVVDVVADRP